MGYVVDTNAHSGTEVVGPFPTGAVDIGSKLKGWATAGLIIGVALLAMKYLAPSGKPRKRKNPLRARRPEAIARQKRLAKQRAAKIWGEAMDEEWESGRIHVGGPRLQAAHRRAVAEERKWRQSRPRKSLKAKKWKLRRRSSAAKRSRAAKKGWRTRKRKARK